MPASSENGSAHHVGAIVGGVIASVVLVCAIIAAGIFYYRRRHRPEARTVYPLIQNEVDLPPSKQGTCSIEPN